MFLQHFTLVLLPLLLLLLARYYRRRRRCQHHHRRAAASRVEPPSPFRLPLIGNLHQLGPLPHRSLRDMSRVHGPLMLLRFGSRPVLVVSSADAAQEVLKDKDVIFANRPSIPAANALFYNCADVAFAPYGEHWRQAKKLCTLHLLNAKRVQSYAVVRAEEVTAMVEKIATWSTSGPVNLSRILSSLSNDIVTRVAVGKKYRTLGEDCDRNSAFCESVEEMSVLAGSLDLEDCFPCLGWLSAATTVRRRMRRCFHRLDGFLEQVLEDHLGSANKDGGGGGDLVDVLLSLHGNQEAATPLPRNIVKAIILDMFAAGTDTSYISLEWAMAELLRNPEAMEKVQREIGRVVVKGSECSMLTEDELGQMTYLEAVIKEVLRLHPPLPLLLPHELTSAAQVGGYEISAKTRVLINAWAIARDPERWQAAEEFRPERFLGSRPVDFRGQDFRYIPFGAGRRMCPGINFAISTINLALANLLHRFDWELPGGASVEDLDMAEAPGMTTRMKSNLLLVAKPRSS